MYKPKQYLCLPVTEYLKKKKNKKDTEKEFLNKQTNEKKKINIHFPGKYSIIRTLNTCFPHLY